MTTVAVLVVTNRPAFVPWWTHQISKQTRKVDQVVVVTNAADPSSLLSGEIATMCGVPDTVVFWQPPHSWVSLGWLRQKALDLCSADILMWFDDDDWYHPRRVDLSCGPIASGRYDAAVFPLTHYYYASDQTLRHMRTDTMLHMPAVAWRRFSVRKARFFHVGAAEDSHWTNRIAHCKWAPPLVLAKRIRWVTDYIYPHIGSIVVVHGANTWQNLEHSKRVDETAMPLPAFPPEGVSAQEWQHTTDYLSSLQPAPQKPQRRFKESTQAEWDVAHQSGLVD